MCGRRLLRSPLLGVVLSGAMEPRAEGCGPRCLRVSAVPGADARRCNELLLHVAAGQGCPANGEEEPLPQHHVVYFPGDVQNYHEVMARHPENYQWESWSLENVAAILARRFPGSYIWVVKCSRMHLHKFSCYDNFVKSNMFGAPEHSADFGAFKHLYTLLVNAFNFSQNSLLSMKNGTDLSKDAEASNCRPDSSHTTNGCQGEKERTCEKLESAMNFHPLSLNVASFTLIGFSKGCVVLNQLLFELKEARKDKDIDAFIKSIRAMYWLDGGHSGGSNTWITYPEVLKELAQTGIPVHAHVTPYQVCDPMRSWIGKEHKKFVQILQDFGVQVTSHIHFAKETPSIENHFRVHEAF
ncbi:mitochondrial protein C2orf69 homolog [Erinaceus europaeus]|uniref:Mitochondrial protein C2orf69 homolog n=1 Tax=Erinaceus europaeus TaxID=9365 RepID=A0A1S3AB05_ERIEU|nr:mitochondrial protein C2orf69 homolog [Erinaceus europaeus]